MTPQTKLDTRLTILTVVCLVLSLVGLALVITKGGWEGVFSAILGALVVSLWEVRKNRIQQKNLILPS